MTRTVTVLAILFGAALSPAAAGADELAPLQASTFNLDTWTASIYYTVTGTDYEVVTTVAPQAGGGGAPVRFVATLAPGQKQNVAVGRFGNDAAPAVLQVAREGDTLSVEIVNGEQRLTAR